MQDWRQEYVEYVTVRIPALRRLAYHLCGDEHTADDLVQETITKLYVHWKRASDAMNLDAYVRSILVRTFLDDKRRGWSRVTRVATTPEQAAADSPSIEDRVVVRAALDRLPRRQRAVLVLRFLTDMSVLDVADVLDCSAATVKSQTFHGLATLRRVLGEPAYVALIERT